MMKLVLAVAGVACVSFIVGNTAMAGEPTHTWYVKDGRYRVVQDGKIVIYTQTTNSRVPERVRIQGQQVNSSSPMYVVQGSELSRSGATTIVGMLALDPSVTSRHAGGM